MRVITTILCAAAGAGVLAGGAAGGGPSAGVRAAGDGVVDRAAGVRYVALPAGSRTSVAAIRVDGGRVVRFGSLAHTYGVPLVTYTGSTGGLAPDGRTLVLEGVHAQGRLRAESRLAVLPSRTLRLRQTIVLRGDFSFDALSPDGRTLYLIQHVSAKDYTRYLVRAYELERGRLLQEIVADKSSSDAVMAGTPVARASTPDGRWVYTLYRGDMPFVHALDTVARRAVCIDLPWSGSQDGLWRLRLALDPSRHELALRDRSGKAVVTIDLRTFRAYRGGHTRSGGGGAAVTAIGGGSGLAVLAGGAILLLRRSRRRT